jgi:2',3'-cyclic-nucleotide 2'-phosphodiesterase (5'-nucleotidase family)
MPLSAHRISKPGLVVATALAVISVLTGVLVGGQPPAQSSETYATPAPPAAVKATAGRKGLTVSWATAPSANPPINRYVISTGKGSCPVTVAADRTSAFVPYLKGRVKYRPAVQAVNAYGLSPLAMLPRTVTLKRPPASSDFRNVQILQVSDFHGALEESEQNTGAAKLATAFALDRKASKATFTVSSGDNIGGGPIISSFFDEVPSIRAINKMKMDVSTFGNHEHDRPLSHLQQMIGLSRFKWTVANYDNLEPLNTSFSEVTDSVLIERAGIKVGFVGMNTEDTASLVAPGNLNYGSGGRAIAISPSVWGVKREAKALRRAGAQVVIALVHQGWTTNENGRALGRLVEVSRQIDGVDAAFGGHTHQTFASIIGGKTTAQPRNSGQEYIRTQICLNTRTGKVVGSVPRFVTKPEIESLTEDPAVSRMVREYQQEITPVFDEKVGEVEGIFPRGSRQGSAPPPIGPVERTGETQLGNLTADALKSTYGTDLVFINGGGIRDTLPANGYVPNDQSLRRPGTGTTGPYDVALGDIKTVFPFGNSAAVSTMTGDQLWGALEHAVSAYPSGRFPQISGFRFAFDLTRPVGSRVTAVTRPDETPIPRDQSEYSVTTIDYMAFGGDGFAGYFNPARASIRGPLDDAVTDYLKSELAAGRTVPVGPLDGRITCLGDQECVPRTWP